jgi:hypothetical protein
MRISAAALAAATLTTAATTARANVDADVRGGYYTDAEHGFVGGGFLMSVAERWDFNPNIEYVFVDGGSLFTVNADIHRDMNSGGGPAIWLGGGPALIVRDSDEPVAEGDSDFGVNLMGGIGASSGSIRPFAQAKYTLSDASEASLAFGLRF